MRADRLISLLMLLQTRGRMTAQELAGELKVSARTIYRDIEALSASGVPVYADRGPGGGCALLDSYRTNLTGLTQPEVRALFMLSIPAPLDQLGVSQELKSALLKLSAALPAARREDQARIRQRIYLDSTGWFQSPEPVPHLHTLYQAVCQDRRLALTIRLTLASFFETHIERTVEPYGLVAKASVWHLVCAVQDTLHTYRVSDILDVQPGEHFQRPAEFDLAAYWQAWCADFEQRRPHYPVTLRIAPQFIAWLPHYFGSGVRALIEQTAPDAQGYITLTLPFEHLEDARGRILGWGSAVEVLEPEALRRSVADFAAHIAALYSKQAP
jgi:predicted DNA-binding transcriptional regulator YafY